MKYAIFSLLFACVALGQTSQPSADTEESPYHRHTLKPDAPKVIAKLFADSEDLKSRARSQFGSELSTLEKKLEGAKKGEIRSGQNYQKYIERTRSYYFVFGSSREKKMGIDSIAGEIDKLKAMYDKARDADFVLVGSINGFSVGSIGTIDGQGRVISVMKDQLILDINGVTVILGNVDTSEARDDTVIPFDPSAVYWVPRTQTYNTAIGGQRTVARIEKLPIDEWYAK